MKELNRFLYLLALIKFILPFFLQNPSTNLTETNFFTSPKDLILRLDSWKFHRCFQSDRRK
jgi:hypothetical protein